MNPKQSIVYGRRIQISGSANFKTDTRLTHYAHDLVSRLVRSILKDGGGLVLGAGKEPRPENPHVQAPSILFDWTAIETAASCFADGSATWPKPYGPPLIVVTSQKSESEIPETRRPLWESLLKSGLLRVESIFAGSRSGAMLRERQAQHGDLLITLGGGTGVEHLADLYLIRRRPVIALDLPLGASRDDGTGGSERIAQKSRENPERFIRFQTEFAGTENARLSSISTRAGTADVETVAENLHVLMRLLARPYVFYTRLLNPKHPKFNVVEDFFRTVVDHVVAEFGFEALDMGIHNTEHAFLNVAVFDNLHYSTAVIADVTGERPNCYIELGYGLGHAMRVIVTAEEGTELPFDQEAIPCHFWDPSLPLDKRRLLFQEFWRKNIDRPLLITN